MRSKTFVFLTAALLASAALAFAGETPEPALEEAAQQQAAAEVPAPAPETAALESEGASETLQPATEELCPAAPVFNAGKGGQPCGGTTCGVGQYCCNPSCNICVPFGMSCTQQSCN